MPDHQEEVQRGGWEYPTPCFWMYNIHVKCSSVAAIHFLRNKYAEQMKPTHVPYLNSLEDNQQFPAAHCNKAHDLGTNICMYSKTALCFWECFSE